MKPEDHKCERKKCKKQAIVGINHHWYCLMHYEEYLKKVIIIPSVLLKEMK
jgi:hypothetical protein